MTLPAHPRPAVRRCVKTSLSLMAAVAAVLAIQKTSAATLTWDSDPLTPGAQDGLGTWDNLGQPNWWDGVSANVQWNSTTPDSAIFGSANGAADIVTLGTNVSVDDITFNAATSGSYTIEGAGKTLTLVNTAITASVNVSATLNVNLAGTTGLAFTSPTGVPGTPGTIRLSGTNTYSGTTSVLGGTLQIDSVGALGNSTQITVGSAATAFGALLINVPDSMTSTIGLGKTATIFGSGVNNSGAIRGADGQSNTWAGNVVIGSTGSRFSGGVNGTLTLTGVISGGSGSPVLFSRNMGATTVLAAVNTYTGDTQIFNSDGGTTATLKIAVDNAINPASRLAALPNVSSGSEVVDLNGHVLTFRGLTTAATSTITSGSNLMVTNNGLAPSTLTISDTSATPVVFGGSLLDGAGMLSLTKAGTYTQVLAGLNTYTGSTTVNGGVLQLGAATLETNPHFIGSIGVLASTNFVLNGGTLAIDNLGSSNSNNARIPDAADFTFGGGAFEYRGSDQAATNLSETVHNLTLAGGYSRISVRFDARTQPAPPAPPLPALTTQVRINANQLTRSAGGGVALLNGQNLGKDSASTGGVSRLLLNNAPTLVGTTAALSSGINSGATDTKIVPFLVGEATATTGGLGTETGIPNTFLTYEAGTGFRPLNPTDEFENNTIVEGANTRITLTTTAATAVALNSIVLQGAGGAATVLNISNKLTVTSGAILFANGNTIGGGNLDFGNVEAVITANSGATGIIGSLITGTNGLTFNGIGSGTLGLGNENSTYSGNTTFRSGTIVPQFSSKGDPGAVTSGPFGTSTLVFAGGGIRGTTSRDVTVGNSIQIQADTTIPAVTNGRPLTLSGPVTLAGGTRRITNSSTGASTTTFSGAIGDGGQNFGLTIAGAGTAPVILSGANTYTGPTTVLSSTLIVSGSLSGTSTTTVGNSASLGTAATLGGSGTLGNVIAIGSGNPATSGATVDPGNSANVAGIMRTGAFSLTNGAHLSLQLGGITAGGDVATGYDQLIASSAVTLTGGDLKLAIVDTPTFTFGDQLFVVVNNSGSAINGTFGTVNGSAFDPMNIMVGSQQFRLMYNGNFSGPGSDGMANDLVLVAVPEPGSFAMLAGALGLLGCARRRRK